MKYEYKKDKLPQPVVKGHEEWVELYDVAWKMAFDNVEASADLYARCRYHLAVGFLHHDLYYQLFQWYIVCL